MEGSAGKPVDGGDPRVILEHAGLPHRGVVLWLNARPQFRDKFKRDAAAGEEAGIEAGAERVFLRAIHLHLGDAGDRGDALRERDLGAFDGLTGRGIRARHPAEAARRDKVGKFYYQPPSGESWADVVLRVRSFLADLGHGFEGQHLWVFTHQAVIMAFRYVLEDIDEQRLLEIDREVQIPNASLTRFRGAGDGLELETFADTRAVGEHSVVTQEESP